jgi:hypothetical protein
MSVSAEISFPEELPMTRTCRLSWLVLALAVSVVTPALADTYYAFSQGGIPPGTDIYTWCDTPPCDLVTEVACETPEGGASLRLNTNAWGGWGVFFPFPHPQNSVDLTAFETGEVRFFVKAPADGAGNPYGNVKLEIECDGSGTPASLVSLNLIDHGWDPFAAGSWQEISVPVCDFFAGGVCDTTCLASITSPFLATLENLPFFNFLSVDYVRWVTPNSHAGGSSVQVQGRQLLVDGEPFVVNGVNYAPVAVCENWQSAWYDRADRYAIDFPLIAASGANAVRLYAPIVSTAMLDAAWANGLYVIPTFNPDADQLTCAAGQQFMRDRFVETVLEWKDHPALLLWLVGNEFNGGMTNTVLCDDWYPQLDSMAAAAHTAEGVSFHPVSTANSDTTGDLNDICQAGCSDDTTLPNLDFWAVQLYRGCTFGTAFAQYESKLDCARPLIVTEFGADSYDSILGAEDETMQADCLELLLDEAGEALAVRTPGGVSAGQVIFEWADEWWKAECDAGTSWCVQDTCVSFNNALYTVDPGINEEWWGIVTLDDVDSDARGLRTAYYRVGDAWLGSVCNMAVDAHNPATGNTTISFDTAEGNATDHALYYGPLNDVSSYAYSGSVKGLGATGSSFLTLPAGSLFWVVVAENGNLQEGCYGVDSAGTGRPCFPDAGNPSLYDVDQTSGWNCQCATP